MAAELKTNKKGAKAPYFILAEIDPTLKYQFF
jgi:hypothetical protein